MSHYCGRMVEWFKAAVLKTAEGQLSEGSNPSSSAIFFAIEQQVQFRSFSILYFCFSDFYCGYLSQTRDEPNFSAKVSKMCRTQIHPLHFEKISVLCLQMLVKNGILSVYKLQEKYENKQH